MAYPYGSVMDDPNNQAYWQRMRALKAQAVQDNNARRLAIQEQNRLHPATPTPKPQYASQTIKGPGGMSVASTMHPQDNAELQAKLQPKPQAPFMANDVAQGTPPGKGGGMAQPITPAPVQATPGKGGGQAFPVSNIPGSQNRLYPATPIKNIPMRWD